MIDIRNGNLLLNSRNFVIKKGLTKDEFINSNLIEDVLSQQTLMFTNYYLKPQLIDREIFIIVLYFNQNDLIEFINISLSNNGNLPSWDNWLESDQLKKKEEHDKWLKMKIGKPPYKYSWGEISSNYDPRSGSSMITIRYNLSKTVICK